MVAIPARNVDSRAAVILCESAVMADSVRAATVEATKNHNASIAYFEESFGWQTARQRLTDSELLFWHPRILDLGECRSSGNFLSSDVL